MHLRFDGVDSASSNQSINLTNTGSSAIEITRIALASTGASSFVQLSNCGIGLGSRVSCIVSIAFVPASSGALSATLAITDTGNASPQSVKLAGTGLN
jgi:trimeric autotransporter adhesin